MIDKATEKAIVERLAQVHIMLTIDQSNEETELIMSVVNRLPPLEKDVIMRKHLLVEADYTTHQDIYTELGISSPTYTKIRYKALYKLGVSLGIIDSDIEKSF